MCVLRLSDGAGQMVLESVVSVAYKLQATRAPLLQYQKTAWRVFVECWAAAA